ncbi:MAG: response regulator [Phototrophicales bacterium]|nr:MAG: response regulator [Phototrophicales bacterium]
MAKLFIAFVVKNEMRGNPLAKVMIVDDDRTTVKLLQTLLELDGFDIVVAHRGGDVIGLAEQTHPDIFLMDYHLNDMHGVEVLRHLRAHPTFANVPVVMTSGLDVSEEVMAAGASAFLVKPFEPEDLPILFNRFIS